MESHEENVVVGYGETNEPEAIPVSLVEETEIASEENVNEEKPTETEKLPILILECRVKASVLKGIVDKVSTLTDEVAVVIDQAGWHIRTVDPAHVAMIRLDVDMTAFELFRICNPTGDRMELGIDLDKLREILKSAKVTKANDPVINLQAFRASTDYILVDFDGMTRKASLFDTSCIDEPKIPNLKLPNSVTMPASDLLAVLKSCETVSDHVSIRLDAGTLTIIAEGDTDRVSKVFQTDLLIDRNISESAGVRSDFPLDYMTKLIKSLKGLPAITLHLGNDYPLKIDFPDGSFLLAPRIESD